MYPTTTEEFESVHGRLEDQPQGSYIVGWSVEDEAEWIENQEDEANKDIDPKDIYGDEYDGIVIGDEE